MILLVAVDGVDDTVGLLGVGVDDALGLLAVVCVVQAARNHSVDLLGGLVGLLLVKNQEVDDFHLIGRGGQNQVILEHTDKEVDSQQQANREKNRRGGHAGHEEEAEDEIPQTEARVGDDRSNLVDGVALLAASQRNQTKNRVRCLEADKGLLALDLALKVEREKRRHVRNRLHSGSSHLMFYWLPRFGRNVQNIRGGGGHSILLLHR